MVRRSVVENRDGSDPQCLANSVSGTCLNGRIAVMPNQTTTGVDRQDLAISRLVRAPRAALWRAWSDPNLLKEWWCPKVKAFDMRPGGAFHTFMSGPEGGTSDNPGCFLEVVAQTRIVFTSMLIAGWRPATPWLAFTAVIAMADEADGTRYVATVMHPDQATSDRHAELGFHQGWNTCIDQLEAFARQLR
jgi:uncharacterized protein YndB with AHSA1/START domain